MALGILVGTVLLVWLDREGYRDNADPTGEVSLVDAFYYTTVTLSTTGYGDIAPVTTPARLINALVITPARVAFLVLLIGTTIDSRRMASCRLPNSPTHSIRDPGGS
jgi:voltage-gated potassium channel